MHEKRLQIVPGGPSGRAGRGLSKERRSPPRGSTIATVFYPRFHHVMAERVLTPDHEHVMMEIYSLIFTYGNYLLIVTHLRAI